jgi:hypothetical protein
MIRTTRITRKPARILELKRDNEMFRLENGENVYTIYDPAQSYSASKYQVRITTNGARSFTVYLGSRPPVMYDSNSSYHARFSTVRIATVTTLAAAHDLLGEDSPFTEVTPGAPMDTYQRGNLQYKLERRIKNLRAQIEKTEDPAEVANLNGQLEIMIEELGNIH